MLKNILLLSFIVFAGISGASTERCVPNYTGNAANRVHGFKCFGIGARGKLARAGLIDGDIILSVDGETLRTAVQAMDLISRIRDDQFVEVRISRDGHQEVLRPN